MNISEIQHISISKKKPIYIPNKFLLDYLEKYDRKLTIPISYKDLERMTDAFPVYDKKGQETHWFKASYEQRELEEIHQDLKRVYSLLKSGGNSEVHEHLIIDSIEYCSFGNSNPFRIKIVNNYNDVYDYFYIKKSDASRIYGLELEHILSPSRINYFANNHTLIEEHIVGIPGDIFIEQYLSSFDYNKKRLAKEFVKFNERCLTRLLGDMRSYNFVIDMTYDFDDIQFRIRAIDFDQQSYEGNYKLYLPQYFKENKELVQLVMDTLNTDVIHQYQEEERSMIARRVRSGQSRLILLYKAFLNNDISTPAKIQELALGLNKYYQTTVFEGNSTMAEIVRTSLTKLLK